MVRRSWILGALILALAGMPALAYDRAAAVAFARDQWAVPIYAGHEYPYAGTDRIAAGAAQPEYVCAEFVSRCLQAGGVDAVGSCPGFRQCISLYAWLLATGMGSLVDSVDELQAGDVIFYKQIGSAKDWSHVVLVIDSITKNVAAHNNARWNAPWTYRSRINEAVAFMRIGQDGPAPPVLSPTPGPSASLPEMTSPMRIEFAEAAILQQAATEPKPAAPAVESPRKPNPVTRFFRRVFGRKEVKPAPEPSPALEPRRAPAPVAVARKPSPTPAHSKPSGKPDPSMEQGLMP